MVSPVRRGLLATLALAGLLAGCGSSGSGGKAPKIGAARTFSLAGFTPAAPVRAGVPTTLSFHIQQPSGTALTKFKTGSGPHTRVPPIILPRGLPPITPPPPPPA